MGARDRHVGVARPARAPRATRRARAQLAAHPYQHGAQLAAAGQTLAEEVLVTVEFGQGRGLRKLRRF